MSLTSETITSEESPGVEKFGRVLEDGIPEGRAAEYGEERDGI